MNGEFRRRLAMLTALVAACVYLTYRVLFTLNLSGPYAIAASVVLFAAEAYGCFLMFLYFFQIWRIENPEPVPPLENVKVDIYIPTYNEDPELLRGTIAAALAIDYPHETWVLDDGKREPVRELCEELGAKYLVRPNNLHAKAGNLNHALEITEGEFIVIFDADHIAERTFITRLLGYFADEKLAFVQTPHSFYNFDNFQAELDYQSHHYWEEGQLFYNCTQPGKNHWNGVSFCGSAAMFRRKALEDVGLVATETITEDMHTGIRLHARGWKSLFVNERLVSGQAAPDITTFNTQRLRWGEGNLGVFAFDNPLTVKGLTLAQRLCYLGSMLSWTTGVQKLVLYVSPMLMLLTGVAPIRELTWTLGLITLAYMFAVWTAVKFSSNGYGNLVGIELTHMACFWTQIQSTYRAIFKRKKTKFVVTSKRGRQKGKGNSIRKFIAPQCWYIAGSAASIAWAGSRYLMGLSNDVTGLLVCGSLLVVNCLFAVAVIRRALKPKCRRFSWRHPCTAHVEYRVTADDGTVHVGQGVTKDVNERGVGILVFEDLPLSKSLELTITAGGESFTAVGQVRWRKRLADVRSAREGDVVGYRYGVQFDGLATRQLTTLWSMSTLYAVARQYESFHRQQYPNSPTAALPPKSPTFHLPVRIVTDDAGTTLRGTTETVDRTSAVVLLDRPLDERADVGFEIASPTGVIEGAASVASVETTKVGARTLYLVTLEYGRFVEQSRGMLQSVLAKGADRRGQDLVRLHPRKSPTPVAKPTAVAVGVAASVAVAVFGGFRLLERDDILLAGVVQRGTASAAEELRIDQMLDEIREGRDVVDEERALRLREVLSTLDRGQDAEVLDEILAASNVRSVYARYQKAQSLEGLGRSAEAAPVFDGLLAELNHVPGRDVRASILLSAARNRANLERRDEAVELFEKLEELGELDATTEREFVGLLATSGRTDDAIRRLEQVDRDLEQGYLLAALYLGREDRESARGEYERILESSPEQLEARRLLANVALWTEDYATAVRQYRFVLGSVPSDPVAQDGLAKALLWSGNFDAAVAAWRNVLNRDPSDQEAQRAYVDAVAGAERSVLTATDNRLLLEVFDERDAQSVQDAFLARLGDALERGGEANAAATVLEERLATTPLDRKLRLRLARLLGRAGEYDRADEQYRILLGEVAPETASRLPAGDSRRR